MQKMAVHVQNYSTNLWDYKRVTTDLTFANMSRPDFAQSGIFTQSRFVSIKASLEKKDQPENRTHAVELVGVDKPCGRVG